MADRPPGNFGRTLREARERRGISLRQIANATKIGMSALEALERNDITRLPGGIFSRAFVRSYAIEVGLDPETTIQDFIAQFPSDAFTAGHSTSIPSDDHQAIDSDRRSATTFVWLIALSVPIAGAILYFSTAGRPTVAPATEIRPEVAATAGVEISPAADDPAALAVDAAVPEPVITPAALPSDRLTVTLTVIGECRLSATVDGEKRIDRLVQAGEQLDVLVRQEFLLTASDAAALVITLNGVHARPLGTKGAAVTVRFTPMNFKDYVVTR